LSFTVPEDLVCVSNGVLRKTIKNDDGTVTYEWFSSNPINNYGISFNLAPYKTIEYNYKSVTGQKIPVTIWVLEESIEKAKAHCPQYLDHLRFFEELCGPYPFRNEKYGVVETSYLGMEHQTIIANGLGYKNNEEGFDWLHHHELAHEWWGNMVTAKDWSDFWIHEAIGGYMQALYTEKLNGKKSYIQYISAWKNFENKKPIAKRAQLSTDEAYFPDMYKKGAWALHTLRYYLGDEIFFKLLRRWAYPNPQMENVTDGSQCRFATTDEFIKIAEDISGKKLDWFFEVYFRQASLPKLIVNRSEDKLSLKWQTENDILFPLPVEVMIDEIIFTVEMKDGTGSLPASTDNQIEIDPDKWLTIDEVNIVSE
jgi:aminopeptidase N